MKEIEHLPAVVLCAASVLPCLTLCPREIRPRETRPLGLDGCKATSRAKPPKLCLLRFDSAPSPRRQFVLCT